MTPGSSPPTGNGRIATPSANVGSEASAAAEVQQAVKFLQSAFSKVDPNSEGGKALIKCINTLSKPMTFSAANTTQGTGIEALLQALARARQQAPLAAMMQQRAMAGAGAPAPPAEGAAAAA